MGVLQQPEHPHSSQRGGKNTPGLKNQEEKYIHGLIFFSEPKHGYVETLWFEWFTPSMSKWEFPGTFKDLECNNESCQTKGSIPLSSSSPKGRVQAGLGLSASDQFVAERVNSLFLKVLAKSWEKTQSQGNSEKGDLYTAPSPNAL